MQMLAQRSRSTGVTRHSFPPFCTIASVTRHNPLPFSALNMTMNVQRAIEKHTIFLLLNFLNRITETLCYRFFSQTVHNFHIFQLNLAALLVLCNLKVILYTIRSEYQNPF